MNETQKFTALRTRLLLDHSFFGDLSMRLAVVPDTKIPTACVDGRTLKYNPDFMWGLPEAEQLGLLAHEVCHCAFGHMWRRNGRDPLEWNIATDYVINEMLVKAGLKLPQGALLDSQYDGLFAEQIYSRRMQKKQQEQQQKEQQKQQGQGQGDPQQGQGQNDPNAEPADDSSDAEPTQGQNSGPADTEGAGSGNGTGTGQEPCPTGEFVDAPVGTEENGDDAKGMTEFDWQVAMEQAAMVASRAGTMPGSAAEQLVKAREPKADWVAETRDFIAQTVPTDQSWTSPSRRHIHSGDYLPGYSKENLGRLVVAVDVSGSTYSLREVFASEFASLMSDARPEGVDVLYVDTRVIKHEEVSPDDPDITLKSMGNGGTYFKPAFDWVAEQGIQPAALIYLTDLEGEQVEDPGYPVLWLAPENGWGIKPEVGRVVRVPLR
jgi:predicted metal-dependent peptidase